MCRDNIGEVKSLSSRQARHGIVTAALEALSDSELVALLGQQVTMGAGIGGWTSTITIAGESVFVKVVRLTDLERDVGSQCTANVFDLPTWYQFGVGEGSTGFNAWRELAAHQAASDWVVAGECENFPLLYHWRELPQSRSSTIAANTADIDRALEFWGHSPAVETRLRALADSSTVVALFLEHFPFVVRRWLPDQLTAGKEQAERAVMLVDQQLLGAVAHLRSQGMSHFDAHYGNVLTDGQRIVVSDFGLATARRFQLSSTEQQFLAVTVDHDLAYSATTLVNAIVGTLVGFRGPGERNAYIGRCLQPGRSMDLTGSLGDTVLRYARMTTLVNDFYWQLHSGNRSADYPAEAIAAALAEAGLPPTA